MTIREAVNKANIKFDGTQMSLLIDFNGEDQTVLSASNIDELEDLWESLVDELETDIYSVDSIEREMIEYKARLALCGVWCNGTISVYGYNFEDAYDAAIQEIGMDLNRMFPNLDIEYSVEIIEEI